MDMGSKLKSYIRSLREMLESGQPLENIHEIKRELLSEIEFWQHERFVHLIVTFLFAIMVMAVFMVFIFAPTIPMAILFVALMVLLVPYIKHYFVLENGVQTLYVIYEEIVRRTTTADIRCIPDEFGIKIPPFKNK